MNTSLLERMQDCPVLVVGDLMLDEFLWGTVSRVSPEAPVPVVEVHGRTYVAGGAANTAANIAALGGRPLLCGVTGNDDAAQQMTALLQSCRVDTAGILVDSNRPTTVKSRVVAQAQQMLRIDRESRNQIDGCVASDLLASIESAINRVRACVLSDYGKGVATRPVVRHLVACCRQRQLPLIVDPKGTDWSKYFGATLVKPNQLEAARLLNREVVDDQGIEAAGRELLSQFGPETAVLITRGSRGMSLFRAKHETFVVPAFAREVFDVTGAGDTVAGTLALALASGADLESACWLASLAAANVVGKRGTATVTRQELAQAIKQNKQAA